jgi:LPXTG-motif cell wall-anchored protein
LNKYTRILSVLALASFATLGLAPSAFSDEAYYSNEDGANIYVDNCQGANFTVTIDGTEYGPGDVASGFSLSSTYSVSADAGVTVGWAPYAIVQGGYGHGGASLLENPGVRADVTEDNRKWLSLYPNYEFGLPFFPSIFYAECSGDQFRFAYIQIFPGLTLDQAGFDADLENGVYLSNQDQFDSLELEPTLDRQGGLAFAPMSTFRNSAYAFWANYLESTFFQNESANWVFDVPLDLEGETEQGVWAWTGWGSGNPEDEEDYEYVEFASSFYFYSNGSELSESGIDDVFQREVSTQSTPATTTTPTLATTGANVEGLMVAGLLAVIAGAGFLTVSRRKRTA